MNIHKFKLEKPKKIKIVVVALYLRGAIEDLSESVAGTFVQLLFNQSLQFYFSPSIFATQRLLWKLNFQHFVP